MSVPPIGDTALGQSASRMSATAPETASEYHAVYEDFKTRGRRFFPDLIVEDAIVSVLMVLIVIACTVAFGTPLEGQADPTSTGYVPRPEWYFLFLFELLKYFPGALEWVGVVVLPGLFFLFLFLLPLLDRGPRRSPRYRPITTAIGLVSIVVVSLLTWRAVQTRRQRWPTTAPNVSGDRSRRPQLVAAQAAHRATSSMVRAARSARPGRYRRAARPRTSTAISKARGA